MYYIMTLRNGKLKPKGKRMYVENGWVFYPHRPNNLFNKIKKIFKYKGLINQNEGTEIPVYENFQLNCELREKFFVSALKTNFLE